MLRNLALYALLTAAVCSLTGCYSVPPYGAYPNMYAPGVPTYRPQPARAGYIMPGEIIQAPSSNIVTAPAIQSTAPQVAPTQAPQNSTTPAGDNPVPQPRDPSANGGKPGRETSLFEAPSEPRLAVQPVSLTDEDADVEYRRPRTVQQPRAVTSNPPFEPRLATESEGDITPVGFQSSRMHHPTFRWIQGFLQYNSRMQSWHLMYDSNPGVEEPNGGELKLTGHLPFTRADHNKLYRIYGHFHDKLLDQNKKPQYVVEDAQAIRPDMLESP